jgi:two-component system sensor histidine kinase UhpB
MERAFGLQVVLEIPPGVPPLDPGQSLAVYRIAQEALRNVARHAGVSQATLTLRDGAAEYELIVSDAGRGCPVSTSVPGQGLGLLGMRERALLAGGRTEVESRPGGGTTVRASFPRTVE